MWLFCIRIHGEYGCVLSMELKILECLSDRGGHKEVSFNSAHFRKWELGI